jgi:hypothetical protein
MCAWANMPKLWPSAGSDAARRVAKRIASGLSEGTLCTFGACLHCEGKSGFPLVLPVVPDVAPGRWLHVNCREPWLRQRAREGLGDECDFLTVGMPAAKR